VDGAQAPKLTRSSLTTTDIQGLQVGLQHVGVSPYVLRRMHTTYEWKTGSGLFSVEA